MPREAHLEARKDATLAAGRADAAEAEAKHLRKHLQARPSPPLEPLEIMVASAVGAVDAPRRRGATAAWMLPVSVSSSGDSLTSCMRGSCEGRRQRYKVATALQRTSCMRGSCAARGGGA